MFCNSVLDGSYNHQVMLGRVVRNGADICGPPIEAENMKQSRQAQ
jgi:hypothetical protein